MIRAAIFDLDGLLVDTEPLWRRAEVEVFGQAGIVLTEAMAAETTGLRMDETLQYWHRRFPHVELSDDQVSRDIDDRVVELIEREATPKKGVTEVLALCEKCQLGMAIASSSSMRIIEAAVETLGLIGRFQILRSAEQEEFGKPDPGVYVTTARLLGVEPGDCVSFEDSINGVLSAKAAGTWCIAVPQPELHDDERYAVADVVVGSLLDVTAAMLQSF